MIYNCSVNPCGAKGAADRMWNLDRKVTRGELKVVCGLCAREARKHGIRAYRLSETLKRDAEKAAKQAGRSQFFKDLLTVAGIDPSKAAASPSISKAT